MFGAPQGRGRQQARWARLSGRSYGDQLADLRRRRSEEAGDAELASGLASRVRMAGGAVPVPEGESNGDGEPLGAGKDASGGGGKPTPGCDMLEGRSPDPPSRAPDSAGGGKAGGPGRQGPSPQGMIPGRASSRQAAADGRRRARLARGHWLGNGRDGWRGGPVGWE